LPESYATKARATQIPVLELEMLRADAELAAERYEEAKHAAEGRQTMEISHERSR
jgi:hypothetical protein